MARAICTHSQDSSSPLTAVFAYRSHTAYTGIIASLLAGHGYVPLNMNHPVEMTASMLARSGCRSVIVDNASMEQLGEILDAQDHSFLIILPECDDTAGMAERYPAHTVIGADALPVSEMFIPPEISENAPAYLLFTSGSTGFPKGVIVTHSNARAFISFAAGYFNIKENDRFSQIFDMTFDCSVFDIFVAWEHGACVCCPGRNELLKLGSFIRNKNLTVYFSVPSTALYMQRAGMLKENSFPSLRYMIFCGESLTCALAEAAHSAAPNAEIENLYGPTELTVACTHYRWKQFTAREESERNIVPIGYPMPGMKYLVVDDDLCQIPHGETGELIMTGTQLSSGYLNDPERTGKSFVIPPGYDEVYYRTGDIVRAPKGDKPLLFLGRKDTQVQIHGARVELGEVEAVVREESGLEEVVAIAWPLSEIGAEGVEVFLGACDNPPDMDSLHKKVMLRLTEYALPRQYHILESLPLNTNGKFDRKKLALMLRNGDI